MKKVRKRTLSHSHELQYNLLKIRLDKSLTRL